MNVPPQRKAESLSIILSFALCATLGILPVNNADASALSPEQSGSQVMGSLAGQAIACGNAFEQEVSSGYRCFMEQMVNGFVLDKATSFANAYGKRLFGEHFSLANRLTYSQVGGGFSGEWTPWFPCRLSPGSSASVGRKSMQKTGRCSSSKA